MSKTKPRDMTGTARCSVCAAIAVHERGPGTPLVIRHDPSCPEFVGVTIRTDGRFSVHANGKGQYRLLDDGEFVRSIGSTEPLAEVDHGRWQLRLAREDASQTCELLDDGTIVGDYDSWTSGLAALAEAERFGWSSLCEEDPDNAGFCAYHRSYCTEAGPGDEH